MLQGGNSSTVFQPIYERSDEQYQVWALEALTRGPVGTHFECASIFFDYVRRKGEEVRVDRWCVASAFARYAALGVTSRLSVNVHACTLERDPAFASFIESAAVATTVDLSRLIVEIVEQSPYFDSSRMLTAFRDLRSLGAKIAVDDVGLGHGNFRTILDAQPEYLKIDRHFVSGAAKDRQRQSLIASTVRIADDFGARIVGEGVDNLADLETLRELNVSLVQGYLLARPAAEPSGDPVDPCQSRLSEPSHQTESCDASA
jgi:EAL domain-containing protein (putative c-di-GMP-specific phosphodiesterase class I)